MPSDSPCYCVTTSSCDLADMSCDPFSMSCDLNRTLCDPASDVCTSDLIPSLTSELGSLITPRNHTPLCSGRIHHSAVYNPLSRAVFIVGGVDLSGVLCPGGVVRIDLDPSMPEVEDEGAWLRPDGVWWEGVGSGGSGDPSVRVIGGGPAGRYLHTSNFIPVSSVTKSLVSPSFRSPLVLGTGG